jgi:hypothetical protein
MCAIDTFYVPFLIGSNVAIQSQCLHCKAKIQVHVDGEEVSVTQPPGALIWHSGADYDCPNTNFFCCRDHLRSWRTECPKEKGRIRTVEEALARGKAAVVRIEEVLG